MATSPASHSPNTMPPGTMPPLLWTASTSPQCAEQDSDSRASTIAASQAELAATRDQVLVDHLPLVRFVARRIHERLPQHVELEDLVSAGIVGLIDAFNKFDASKKVQFGSYAQFRIRGAILDSLRTLDWASRELRRKGRNMAEAVRKLTQQLNRAPSESEIAAELGMALDRYQQLIGNLKSLEIGSLQETHSDDSPEQELACLPTPPDEDPLYRCMQTEISAKLYAAVAALPEREARVLALYYIEEMTLKEIGLVLGLVESRVSQIRASAVNTLRARFAPTVECPEKRPVFEMKKAAQMKIPAAVIRRNVASHRAIAIR